MWSHKSEAVQINSYRIELLYISKYMDRFPTMPNFSGLLKYVMVCTLGVIKGKKYHGSRRTHYGTEKVCTGWEY